MPAREPAGAVRIKTLNVTGPPEWVKWTHRPSEGKVVKPVSGVVDCRLSVIPIRFAEHANDIIGFAGAVVAILAASCHRVCASTAPPTMPGSHDRVQQFAARVNGTNRGVSDADDAVSEARARWQHPGHHRQQAAEHPHPVSQMANSSNGASDRQALDDPVHSRSLKTRRSGSDHLTARTCGRPRAATDLPGRRDPRRHDHHRPRPRASARTGWDRRRRRRHSLGTSADAVATGAAGYR